MQLDRLPLTTVALRSRRGHASPFQFVAVLAIWCLSLVAGWSASQEEILTQVRQFRYGEDAAALTEVERQVAAATDNVGDGTQRQTLARSLAAILETDAAYEAKQFVCRQLAILGTPEQVPVLAKLLADDTLSDMARYALGPIPGPAVNQALVEALGRTRGKTQIGLINTLGFRRDTAAVGPLGELLAANDAATANAAAAALGRIGGTQVQAMLRAARRQPKAGTQFAIADGLLECLDGLVRAGRSGEATADYETLFQAGQPSQIRVAALRALAAIRGPAGASRAVLALRDPDPLVTRAAIGCVQFLPGREATRQFAVELPTLQAAQQVVLLGALADRGDAAALPAVLAAAKSADVQLRVAGLAALGHLGDASVVELLAATASGGGAAESAVALASLRSLLGAGVDQAILRSLENAPATARPPLVRVLADRQSADAVPVLLRLAGESDERTAVESSKALAQLATPANLPALLLRLRDARTAELREAAEEAVVAASRRIADASQQAGPVLAAWREESSEPMRCSLLRVLGGIGGAEALAALQQSVRADAEPVRDAAVRALADWENPADVAVLVGVLRATENPTQRILLLRGLVRLMALESKRTPAQTLDLGRQVLQQARGTDETRQALSLIATVSDPRALPLVEPYLQQDSVREEAAMAAVKIAAAVAGAHPDLVRQTLQRVLAVSQNDAVKQAAGTVLQGLDKNAGFITAWQVAGPFTAQGLTAPELFDRPFPPETASDKTTAWRKVSLGAAKGPAPTVDLLALIGGTQRVAYLRTWIHAETASKARLEIGSDDGVKVWLNGVVVHANNSDRGLVVGEDKVPVTLQTGWNSLLLKVTQGGGGWAACVRLRDPDGNPLGNLRFDCAHGDTSAPAK